MSKAIATNFNCPFVTIPGSGFAATFIGIDVIVVMFLIRKAKKLARKWGGQCCCFHRRDRRRRHGRASGRGTTGMGVGAAPSGARASRTTASSGGAAPTPTGDLILETRAWRERLFA